MSSSAIHLIRVFRASRGESLVEARERRPELVTLDAADLFRIVTRCKTTLARHEIESVARAAEFIPQGASADIVLTREGRAWVEVRGAVEKSVEVRANVSAEPALLPV